MVEDVWATDPAYRLPVKVDVSVDDAMHASSSNMAVHVCMHGCGAYSLSEWRRAQPFETKTEHPCQRKEESTGTYARKRWGGTGNRGTTC